MEDLRPYVHYYLLSTALYTFLYYLVAERLLPKLIPAYSKLTVDQTKEWVSNTASIVTSLICAVGTVMGLGMQLEGDVKFTILQVLVTAMTGYWVSDTIFRMNNLHVLKNRRFQYFLVFHHLLGIIAIQIAVLQREMMDAKLVFILMEVGSLFINVRFCLLDLNFDRSHPVYERVSHCMIATFFLTRLLPVPYMYHEGYKCVWLVETCSAACRPFITFNSVLYTIFTILNCYWFYVMVIGLVKHNMRKTIIGSETTEAAQKCTQKNDGSIDDLVTDSRQTADIANSVNNHTNRSSETTQQCMGFKNLEDGIQFRDNSDSIFSVENQPITVKRVAANQIRDRVALESNGVENISVDKNGNSYLIEDQLKHRNPGRAYAYYE